MFKVEYYMDDIILIFGFIRGLGFKLVYLFFFFKVICYLKMLVLEYMCDFIKSGFSFILLNCENLV